MTLKYINRLLPKHKNEPIGRGESAKFTYGFYEETVSVDFDAFDHAFPTQVECRTSLTGKPTFHKVVGIEFSKGQMHTLYFVTFREYTRVFGMPFPLERLSDEDQTHLVLRPQAEETKS